ncbi:DUF4861 domain-containing protein [Acetobacteroides hydrogenigenes]|uniref:Uncharacterized protein DUF4861 n=1 Tax=Acetobacteroides hydrogenigenes TaxID=979970 RepID=A0A4R2EVU2_9BACT|nr:DUF4861 domain-containing protein [Acetobacteroides hydrogenigenes]TCN72806.1 uncharacterized protein DUF4861 [Acetobacteroides hydrogenigenes]
MRTGIVSLCFLLLPVLGFSQSGMRVKLTNREAVAFTDYMVKLPLEQVKSKIPSFEESKFVAVDDKREIALQVISNGRNKHVIFPANIGKNGKKTVLIRRPSESFSYPKRTYAEIVKKEGGVFVNRKYQGGEWVKTNFIRVPDEHTDHSFDIKYEGPGWESDKVGYRFYLDWRNATDLFGKVTSAMVLDKVGVDGFDSYHELSSWGMDVLKVGPSLGVGSIAYWDGEKANRVAKTDSVVSRIVADGIIQSKIETIYYGWEIGGTKHLLKSVITIDAGSRTSKQELFIEGELQNLCTGIIKDPKAELLLSGNNNADWGFVATWGPQSLNKDNLGLAVLYRKSDLIKEVEDKDNHVVVLKPTKGQVQYYFLGAWELEKDGIKTKSDFLNYLSILQKQLSEPVTATIF